MLSPKEHIAEFMYTLGEADKTFSIIVFKKDITPVLPGLDYYLSKEMYYTISTNDFDTNAKDILKIAQTLLAAKRN